HEFRLGAGVFPGLSFQAGGREAREDGVHAAGYSCGILEPGVQGARGPREDQRPELAHLPLAEDRRGADERTIQDHRAIEGVGRAAALLGVSRAGLHTRRTCPEKDLTRDRACTLTTMQREPPAG